MRVLLIRDVPKLGRAGDLKKVADGYGRNYLIPQGMAILATAGAMKQAQRIKEKADEQRAILNNELSGIAKILDGKLLTFAVRASETGRLYGSVSATLIANAIKEKYGIEINHRQVETDPLRDLGKFSIPVRLTIDLLPAVTVIIHREGEAPSLSSEAQAEPAEAVEESVEESTSAAAEA